MLHAEPVAAERASGTDPTVPDGRLLTVAMGAEIEGVGAGPAPRKSATGPPPCPGHGLGPGREVTATMAKNANKVVATA
jgi:hypothetical protein